VDTVCLSYLFTENLKNLSSAQCVKICNALQIQHCIFIYLHLHTPVYLGYAICATYWYGMETGLEEGKSQHLGMMSVGWHVENMCVPWRQGLPGFEAMTLG